MHKTVLSVVVCGLMLGVAQTAAAQGKWDDRAYINIGFGVESGSSDLNDGKTFTKYDEPAEVISTSTFSSGSLFDVGVGARVFSNFSVGVGYHQEDNTADGTLTGSIPNPIFFNQPRTFTTTVPGLTRKENAVHLVFGWMVPVGSNFDVLVFAGPSFFRLEQEVVSDVSIAEKAPPFSEVVVEPKRTVVKQNPTGYNVGADATYVFWQNDSVKVGGGFFIRYATATADVQLATQSKPTKVGGLQFGFGGRFRF